MTDEEESHTHYGEARRSFEDLDVEERTRFLVEATASTLARGLLQAGEALADGLAESIRQARQRSSCRSEKQRGAGAAEPETAQRQAPRSSPDSTDPDA